MSASQGGVWIGAGGDTHERVVASRPPPGGAPAAARDWFRLGFTNLIRHHVRARRSRVRRVAVAVRALADSCRAKRAVRGGRAGRASGGLGCCCCCRVQHRGAKPRRRIRLRAVVAIGCKLWRRGVTRAREAGRGACHGACVATPARPQLGEFVELVRAGRVGPRSGVELVIAWRRAGRAG